MSSGSGRDGQGEGEGRGNQSRMDSRTGLRARAGEHGSAQGTAEGQVIERGAEGKAGDGERVTGMR